MLRQVFRTAGHTACALVLMAGTFALPCPSASADTVSELEQKVKDSASSYDQALSRQSELAGKIKSLNSDIADLEKTLPQQQERSDESLCALYKYQATTSNIVLTLLSSKSFTDALSIIDQYNWIIDYNVSEVEKTQKMQKKLESSKSELESSKQEADEAAASAKATLEEAKQAREEAKQAALAAQKAEEEAAAKEKAANQNSQKKETKAEKKAAKTEKKSAKTASADNVNWSSDKKAFVSKWTSRINSYLSGSPTAGTGKYYAEAAWDYGVDPRWAPAISCIESGKGAHCFRSHNAWGFGGSGFSSWEEGIKTVVAKLGSSTYGGYLTKAAAQTYCPSGPTAWYNNVAAQMAKI